MLTAEPCNVNLYFVMLHYGSKLFFISFYLIALVRGGRWVRDVFSLQECRSECKQAECLLCSLPSGQPLLPVGLWRSSVSDNLSLTTL